MAKNMVRTRNANVVIPLTIADATAGSVVKVGAAGLTGYVTTDAYGEIDAASEVTYPQGVGADEVMVELIGISLVVNLEVASASGVAVGAAVYVDSDGAYTETATDNDFIGYALAAIADGDVGPVGLASFAPAVVTS